MIDIEIFIGIALISGVLVFLLYRLFQAVAKIEELEKENKEVQQKLNGAYQSNKELLSGIKDMENTYIRQGFFYENVALPFYEIATKYGTVQFFPKLREYHILDLPEVEVSNCEYLDGVTDYARFIQHNPKEFFCCSIEGCCFEDDAFYNFKVEMIKYIQRIGFNIEAFNREDLGKTIYIVFSGSVRDR